MDKYGRLTMFELFYPGFFGLICEMDVPPLVFFSSLHVRFLCGRSFFSLVLPRAHAQSRCRSHESLKRVSLRVR